MNPNFEFLTLDHISLVHSLSSSPSTSYNLLRSLISPTSSFIALSAAALAFHFTEKEQVQREDNVSKLPSPCRAPHLHLCQCPPPSSCFCVNTVLYPRPRPSSIPLLTPMSPTAPLSPFLLHYSHQQTNLLVFCPSFKKLLGLTSPCSYHPIDVGP